MDDEREWLPNPRQKNHPLPLPVDEVLYQTWEQVTEDIRRLVQGKDGLNVEHLAQLQLSIAELLQSSACRLGYPTPVDSQPEQPSYHQHWYCL